MVVEVEEEEEEEESLFKADAGGHLAQRSVAEIDTALTPHHIAPGGRRVKRARALVQTSSAMLRS